MPENDTPVDSAATAAPVEPAVTPEPTSAPEPVTTEPVETTSDTDSKSVDLEAVNKALRDEAAKNRIKARDAQANADALAKKAAEDAAAAVREEFKNSLAQAFGIGETDTPPTAEELATQAAERAKAADEKAKAADAAAAKSARAEKNAQVELALYRAADAAGADASALLDSRTFLKGVKDLDPSAADFAEQVSAKVTAAIETNPRFKKASPRAAASPRSGGDLSAGNGEPKPNPADANDIDAIRAGWRRNRESR